MPLRGQTHATPLIPKKTKDRFACLKPYIKRIKYIIRIFALLCNICLSLYLIFSNTKAYIKYGERVDYLKTQTVIEGSGRNITLFFIHRSGISTQNCADNAIFYFDPDSVYKNIYLERFKT